MAWRRSSVAAGSSRMDYRLQIGERRRRSPWWLAVVGIVAAWGGVIGYGSLGRDGGVGADRCAAGGGSTLVFVDTTDGIDDRAALLRSVDATARGLGDGERLLLFVIDGEPSHAVKPLFSACKPKDPARADGRFENPRQLGLAFDKTFLSPLHAALDGLAATPSAHESNILGSLEAALWAPAWRETGGPRSIVLHSNLLENGKSLSHLHGPLPNVCKLIASPLGERLRSQDLKGARVEIVYVRDPKFSDRQGAAHLAWWAGVFTELGVKEVRENGRVLKGSGDCAAAHPTLVNGVATEPAAKTAAAETAKGKVSEKPALPEAAKPMSPARKANGGRRDTGAKNASGKRTATVE